MSDELKLDGYVLASVHRSKAQMDHSVFMAALSQANMQALALQAQKLQLQLKLQEHDIEKSKERAAEDKQSYLMTLKAAASSVGLDDLSAYTLDEATGVLTIRP